MSNLEQLIAQRMRDYPEYDVTADPLVAGREVDFAKVSVELLALNGTNEAVSILRSNLSETVDLPEDRFAGM